MPGKASLNIYMRQQYMRRNLAECLREKEGENANVTGSSRHNTGFVGDLSEFYKPVSCVCYPRIILLPHMAWLRISSIKQAGRSQGQRFIAEWRPLPGRKPSSQLFNVMTINAQQMHAICVYKPVLVGVAVPNRIICFHSTFGSIKPRVPKIPFHRGCCLGYREGNTTSINIGLKSLGM